MSVSSSCSSAQNTSISVKSEAGSLNTSTLGNVIKIEPMDTESQTENQTTNPTLPKTPTAAEQGRAVSPMFTPSPKKRIKGEPGTPKDSPIRGLPFSPSQVINSKCFCIMFDVLVKHEMFIPLEDPFFCADFHIPTVFKFWLIAGTKRKLEFELETGKNPYTLKSIFGYKNYVKQWEKNHSVCQNIPVGCPLLAFTCKWFYGSLACFRCLFSLFHFSSSIVLDYQMAR